MIPPRVHLVGIGGIGLSAIARVLVGRGIHVSGSDLAASPITDELEKLGVRISIGHHAENVGDADLVLVTSAARSDNPEILEAKRRGLAIVNRHDFFPELTAGKITIAIAGTHGKTTTTAMIATILVDAGLDPDVVVGGIVPELKGNGRAGKGEYFVVEADEYGRAFLGLRPNIAVVTSIEMDHPDVYRDLDDITEAFRKFMALVPRDGLVVGCGEDSRVSGELRRLDTQRILYGFDGSEDWCANNIEVNSNGGNDFLVWCNRVRIGEYSLRIPGRHNILNALAALAIADRVGVDPASAHKTLAQFRGAARRFQVMGEFGGITIVDDYAHHPTEIRATLSAARERFPGRTIWAVFQPHTFSRTAALMGEFADAFGDADHVIITKIFAARERENLGVSGAQIVAKMTHAANKRHPDAQFIDSLDACAEFLMERLRASDVLITLGAGDVSRVGVEIAQLKQGA
jgi:UDP-N-acetylmuramate--alanine ligase